MLGLECEIGLSHLDGLTNDNREETDNVEHEQQAFDQRKLLSQSSVEEDGKGSDRNDQESSMPRSLAFQRVFLVVKRNQPLDDSSTQERDGANRSLPASETKPADDVRQEALEPRR